jgi:hypothetical protein
MVDVLLLTRTVRLEPHYVYSFTRHLSCGMLQREKPEQTYDYPWKF